ncbi:MAG TPA: hypothetical protein VNS19_15795 [Acidimicrobiales bacterium]|nr:hypothetical protein [Acidimicrobiales bacterium]
MTTSGESSPLDNEAIPPNVLPTFRSTSASAARWVWHPAVHELFSESCLYFLCRLSSPRFGDIVRSVQDLTARAGITAASIYPVLGPYDVLIRCWATEDRRRRFLLEARKASDLVEQLLEFRTEQYGIQYDWWPSFPDQVEGEIHKERPQISQIVKADTEGLLDSEPSYQDILRRLSSRGLVHLFSPDSDEQDIKFYVVLQGPNSLSQPGLATENELRRFVEGSDHSVRNVSIYKGHGFGLFLVKGVCANYPEMTANVSRLADVAANLGLRPMTLLLVSPNGGEADSIQNVEDGLSESVRSLIQQMSIQLGLEGPLSDELGNRFKSVKRTDRESYADLVDAYPTLFVPGEKISNIFFRILYSVITDEVDDFAEALNFLQRLESLLRRYLRRLWVERFGASEWVARVQQILADSDSPRAHELSASSVDVWTMRDLAVIGGVMGDSLPDLGQEAELDLGSEWETVVSRVSKLRNDVAHGRAYEYKDLAAFWPMVDGHDQSVQLKRVLDAGVLFVRLSNLND